MRLSYKLSFFWACFCWLVSFAFMMNTKTLAQCGVSTSAPASICAGDTALLQVQGAATALPVEWDMCSGDLFEDFQVSNLGSPTSGITSPRALTMVFDQNQWYGFTFNSSVSNLRRIDFAGGIDSLPSAVSNVEYSTNTAVISSVTWSRFQFINQAGQWHAFSVTAGSVLTRIDFPTAGLTADTVSYAYFNNSNGLNLSSPQDLELITVNDTHYILVANRLSTSITVYSLGTNVTNTPTLVATHALSGLSWFSGIDLGYHCGTFYALITSLTDGKVAFLDFGNSILNTPVQSEVSPSTDFSSAIKPYLIRQNNQWLGLVKQRDNDVELSRIFFGPNLTATPDSIVQYDQISGLLQGWAFDLVEENSETFAIGINNNSTRPTYRLNFNDPCNGQEPSSSSASVNHVFQGSGLKVVELTYEDSTGVTSTIADSVDVIPSVNLSASIDGTCDGDTFSFIDLSSAPVGSITGRSWSLEGQSNSSDSLYEVVISGADTLNFSFEAYNSFGCTATLDSTIIVHPYPNLNIQIDSACRGASLEITNGSNILFDSISAWAWAFNGIDSAFIADPSYAYLDTGIQQVVVSAASSFSCVSTDSIDVYVKDAPVAALSITRTCFNDSTAFISNAGSTVPFTLLWDFGDGGSSSEAVAQHLYADTGSYDVKLIVNAENGCADSSSEHISITPKPTATISNIGDTRCTDDLLEVEGQAISTSISESIWLVNNDQVATGDDTLIQFLDSGSYSLTYVVNSGSSCFDSASTIVFINKSPDFDLEVLRRCAGDTVQMRNEPLIYGNQSLASASWQIDGIGTINGLDADFFQNEPAQPSVLHTLLTDSGCSVDTLFDLHIVESAGLTFDLDGPPFCTDLPISTQVSTTFDAADSLLSASTFIQYDNGQVDSAGALLNEVVFEFSGISQVFMMMESYAGCVIEETETKNIRLSPSISIDDDSTCRFSPVSFEDGYGGSNYTRLWNFGDQSTSTSETPTHIFTDSGMFEGRLRIVDESSQCFDIDSFTIRVFDLPSLSVLNDSVCQGNPIIVQSTLSNPFDSLTYADWSFPSGQIIGVTNPVVTFETPGVVPVEVAYQTALGCVSTELEDFFVDILPEAMLSADPPFGNTPAQVSLRLEASDDAFTRIIVGSDTFDVRSLVYDVLEPQQLEVIAIVENKLGCMSSDQLTLNFLDPVLDAAVVSVDVNSNGNEYAVSAQLINSGLVPISMIEVALQASPEIRLVQTISEPLEPSELISISFSSVTSEEGLDFACVEVLSVDGSVDDDPSNNELCEALGSQLRIAGVYPNPTSSENATLVIDVGDCNDIQLEIFATDGRLMYDDLISTQGEALIKEEMNLRGFQSGIYIARVSCNGKEDHVRLNVN